MHEDSPFIQALEKVIGLAIRILLLLLMLLGISVALLCFGVLWAALTGRLH
jgi:hypothetical protein